MMMLDNIDFKMPRCFLSAKIPSAAGGNVMSDEDQETQERRDDNYNLNSDKHLGLFQEIEIELERH